MPAAPTFPSPASIEALVASTLADAEFDALDALEMKAATERLFWNHGSVSRAIGDDTDPECRGAGYWGLLTLSVAVEQAGRPDLIAARHVKAAESVERQIAHTEQTIVEKQARIAALRAHNWPASDVDADILAQAVEGLRASLPGKRAAAAQLRARAAELTGMKVAA